MGTRTWEDSVYRIGGDRDLLGTLIDKMHFGLEYSDLNEDGDQAVEDVSDGQGGGYGAQ